MGKTRDFKLDFKYQLHILASNSLGCLTSNIILNKGKYSLTNSLLSKKLKSLHDYCISYLRKGYSQKLVRKIILVMMISM